MILIEQHIYKRTHRYYKELDKLCFLSKNLYNATIYEVRQYYFKTKKYLNYYKVNKLFTQENQVDYRSLPAKVSKHTQQLVDRNMKSFFSLLKNGKRVKLPRYLNKVDGRQLTHYERGALSFVKKEGYIHLSRTNIYIKSNIEKEHVKFVRVVPKGDHITVEVGYEVEEVPLRKNKRYASIDLGVNNLAVVSSNVMEPFIINGLPIKSINQYYNKMMYKIQSELLRRHNKYTSNRSKRLTFKRNNKIKDYMHKASTYIMNQLVSNDISLLVVGYNKGWKQDIKLGSKTNQKFVQVPYRKFVDMLEYKGRRMGVEVVKQEESYTSKCSFYDDEVVERKVSYKGVRKKRGLYVTSVGKRVNADLNASMNIMRKYLEKKVAWNKLLYLDCVEVSSVPYLQRVTL